MGRWWEVGNQVPRVTVGMPVFNSEKREFERAFFSIIEQDFEDFEIVLSDNGSRDSMRYIYEKAAASDPRVRYVRHAENYGAIFNFNYVLEVARGEYFLWAADDDFRGKTYLRKTVALLDRHRDAVTAGTQVVNIDGDERRIGRVSFNENFSLDKPSKRVPVRGCCAADFMDIYSLHRRSSLMKIHPAQLMHGSDVLMIREMLMLGKVVRVDEELFFYKVPTGYSLEELPRRLMGSKGRSLPFRQPVVYLALRILLAAVTIDAEMEEKERTACVFALLSSLLYYGWLTPRLREYVRKTLPKQIVEIGWTVAKT